MPRLEAPSGHFALEWDDDGASYTLSGRTLDDTVSVSARIPASSVALSHPALAATLDAAAGKPGAASDAIALEILKRIPARTDLALGYLAPTATALARWVLRSREVTNFSYELTPLNRRYLAHFLADALDTDAARVQALFEELRSAPELRAHLTGYAQHPTLQAMTDRGTPFGRRIAWYAIVRLLKPRLVVETGVDQGLGALVLCEALRRNRLDGAAGRYVGLDIVPHAGAMLSGPWAEIGSLRIGDAITTIGQLDEPVDLYVSDSDHSADYEYREYLAMARHLSPGAAIIADNAHATDCLCRYAEETGRRFGFFREQPEDHWYPGGGIGLSLPAR